MIVLICILICYSIFVIIVTKGWIKLKNFVPVNSPSTFLSVSVIVPFRNEENNLRKLCNDLINQDYPKECFEVIFINDHSSDKSYDSISMIANDTNNIKIISLPENVTCKKAALECGIKNSTGDFIVFTDADCTVSPRWLSSYNYFYFTSNCPDFVIGLVELKASSNSLFQKFQLIEFISLVGTGAGAASVGMPLYCNSANLFIKKSTYLKYNNPFNRNNVSGDDTFLLHHIKKDPENTITVIKAQDCIVRSDSQPTLKEYLNQRIRWAAKSKYYKDFHSVVVSFLVLFTNLGIVISFIFSITKSNYIYLLPFAFKVLIDFFFFRTTLAFFKKKALLYYLPIFELFYLIYVFTIALLSFTGFFYWKGRKFSV